MCIQLDDAFSDAVNTVKPFLIPCDNLNFFLRQLKGSDLIRHQPLKIFELLATLFSTDYEWPDRDLRDIITEIRLLAPEIEKTPKFIEMSEFLLTHDL